jgi:hypothetical protein
MGVEGAAHIMSFVILTIVDLDNVWHNNQLKYSGKNIGTKVTAETLHNPDELGYFQKRVR